jgi:hypothetical protein
LEIHKTIRNLSIMYLNGRVIKGVLRSFNCMDTFTPSIFLAYFGDMFFSLFSIIWGHSVMTSCWSRSEFQWQKFEVGLWYCYFHKKIVHLRISGINLCHLGAELSILRCRKRFRGG